VPGFVEGPGGGLFPFQNIDILAGPPQVCVEFPEHDIEQSVAGERSEVESILFPQSTHVN